MSLATMPARLTTGGAPRPIDGAWGRRDLGLLVAAIVLLLCVASASIWQAGHNALALTVAQTTRIQRNLATDILALATAAETAQRGFLLTLDPSYLDALGQAEVALPHLVQAARSRWPDDRRLVVLQQAVTAKLAELRRTATLAQSDQLASALAIVRTHSGYVNMAVIRRITAEVTQEQDVLLLDQVARATRGSRLLVAIDVAGLVMVFALAGLIALGLRSYLAALRAAQDQAVAVQTELERTNSRLDETVITRTADLTAANEEIQRFAYIVSHDLRAPLVNIMGFTSELEQATALLARELPGDAPPESRQTALEDIAEALRFIKASTEKMDRLINAILRLSREGRRSLAPERLEMGPMLSRLLETMGHQIASTRAEVTVGEVPDLVADRLVVEQVFGNIVENALKYSKPGRAGRIRIEGRLEGAMARFDISDNGRGIAKRDYERVFELFRRAGDQSVAGEGIGLAHVRALVRRVGGSIECVSEVDVGSTFIVRLPAVAWYEREGQA